MPLLMCPNDNAAMQTVRRDSIEFDMCPACRGVWLDRGELEKLMEGARGFASAHDPRTEQRPERDHQHGYGDERAYGERANPQGRQRRRRDGFDIFDIFD